MCEHKFKPLKIERDGKKVQACQKCGALKIGEDTVVVNKDHVDLAPLTADPALAEGRMWFRSDTDKAKWSPDGAIVEEFSTAGIGGPDLTSIMGFVYLASGAATDSWNFTADPSESAWIRQYSTAACFQSKYNFYGTYAHWTADNTFVNVPNKADNVYGAGEVLSVSRFPDGTEVDRWFAGPAGLDNGPQGMTWDGDYLWMARGDPGSWIYRYTKGGTRNAVYQFTGHPSDITFDGTYYWTTTPFCNYVYQLSFSGGTISQISGFPEPGVSAQGITWDGEYLWICDLQATGIYKYTPGGVEKGFLDVPWGKPEGMGYDGLYLINLNDTGGAGSPNPNWCYQIKKDGTVVNSFTHPGGTGEACAWDGKYVWCNDESSGYVYVYSDGKFDLNYEVSPV